MITLNTVQYFKLRAEVGPVATTTSIVGRRTSPTVLSARRRGRRRGEGIRSHVRAVLEGKSHRLTETVARSVSQASRPTLSPQSTRNILEGVLVMACVSAQQS
jgi:hypothetical protein